MSISRRAFLAGSAASIVSLTLAACGGSQNNANGGASSTSNQSKTYSIATDTTFAPFEFADSKGGYAGIDIEILAAIATNQKFAYDLKPLGFDAALQAVQSGQADAVIAGMSITEERKKIFDFSDPYFDSTVCAAAKADGDIKTLEDLKDKAAAVKTGTMSEKWAESIKDKYGFRTVQFDSSDVMYQDVVTGNTAVCFEDTPVMGYAISTGAVPLKIVQPTAAGTEFATPYGFAVKKGSNADLLSAFNAGLHTIKGNGEYQKIIDRYIAK